MKRHVSLIAALVAAVTCRAANKHVLSTSPNKQITIVEVRADTGESDYYFVHQPTGKKLGFVLPPEQRRQISNVAVVASWNTSSAKVALLVFYGTKLSELLLFVRTDDGTFQQVELEAPDPDGLYRKRTGKTIPRPGDGYSENAVGPWLDQSTVALIAGGATQTEQSDQYLHLFVTFRARINGRRALLSDLKLLGPLSNEESERFLKGCVSSTRRRTMNERTKA